MKKSMHFLRTIVASMFGNPLGIYIGEKFGWALPIVHYKSYKPAKGQGHHPRGQPQLHVY